MSDFCFSLTSNLAYAGLFPEGSALAAFVDRCKEDLLIIGTVLIVYRASREKSVLPFFFSELNSALVERLVYKKRLITSGHKLFLFIAVTRCQCR